ncbi:MAG: TIGR02186 family protein [Methylocystaceae bacterium]|nr:TIGR02186 family protein [Methylocystaceae bacterium]
MKKTFLSLLTLLLLPFSVQAQEENIKHEIVAALDDHVVAIDTGFSGSKILLFGSILGDGDVIVAIRGPSHREIVRKKARMMGIWANKEQVVFSNTPAFYKIAASDDLDDLLPATERQRLELGSNNVKPYLAPEYFNISTEKKDTFWQALVRSKKRDGLYSAETDKVNFLGKRLFRADIDFPSNVPVGTYLAYVYLVSDKEVVHTQVTPIIVSKIGVEAGIYDFAQRHSLAYGVIAVVIALVAGWLASIAFRK